jgi:2-polyprenyl-6-methoxyphenol hydroxylase-like FAD-dependent oxidoreductase
MNDDVLPVLIVGAGPVGLVLAIELGMAGVRCTVIEKRDGSVHVPKLSTLSTRCMEINRRLGIAEKVKQFGWPATFPNDYVYCTSLTGYELARDKFPAYADLVLPFTPEPAWGCAQIYYDPILLERARSLPFVTIRHLTSLESFTQDAESVRATVIDEQTGERETIAARYLVGCDGARGTVVRALGFGYEGIGLVAESLNIFFRSAELINIHDKGWAKWYRFTDSGGTWAELIGIDGKELWRLTVLNADTAIDARAYIGRMARTDVDYEILSEMSWERRERVTEHYRDARVFICGDAAHETSPTGGLGLHTGVGDAVDLAWKLTALIEGWGGVGLLDSYEIERRPIALDNVTVSTDLFNIFAELPGGSEIDVDSPQGVASRLRFTHAYEPHHARVPQFTENLRLGYCYESSPICVADGTVRPAIAAKTFVPVARPGTRAPHAWIADGRSTLDLFGREFVLLRIGGAPPPADALVEAARKRGVPLRVVDQAEPEVRELYERALVLVRPDGHVAWRDDVVPSDSLALIDRVRGAE